LQIGVDWEQTTGPGTSGIFVAAAGGFLSPKGAPNRGNAVAFLKAMGSKVGQETFANAQKTTAIRNDSVPASAVALQLQRDEQTAQIVINQAGSVPDSFLKVSDRSVGDFAKAVVQPNADIDAAVNAAVQAIANVYSDLK
jgi:hypothetical protein